MNRLFSPRQRLVLALRAGGRCQSCGIKLDVGFHADHVTPWSRSGQTLTTNGAALCATCNLRKGSKMATQLREWQQEGIAKAMSCYGAGRKHFVADAAPGAGKTLFAIHLAKRMIEEAMIDRIVVIAPRNEIVTQWSKDFKKVTGHAMTKITSRASRMHVKDIEPFIASTWAGLRGIQDGVQAICRKFRVLVIADEVHHAALTAAWGKSADGGMSDAKFVLALSGTPIRSDGQTALWLSEGIESEDFVQVTYGKAVVEKWCVPVTFHRHHGEFEVNLDGQIAEVTSLGVQMPQDMEKTVARSIAPAIRFEKLVKAQTRDENNRPRLDSYHSTMLDWAAEKLEGLRSKSEGEFGKPDAGALVIAPNISTAKYFAELIELKWPGEKVAVVHSEDGESAQNMSHFRHGNSKWIVSVNMISEGVDIHRLRVMVFLPMASTELYFRQALGRIVRKQNETDNSRAYMIMPELGDFVEYAKRVERDMALVTPPQPKHCPSCGKEVRVAPRAGHPCEHCGYEPPPPPDDVWTCNEYSTKGCSTINIGGKSCHSCGMERRPAYGMTLEEAKGWRDGVITRGEELEESSVKKSEEIIGELQMHVVKTGNARMMRIMQLIPEEMYSEVEEVFRAVRGAKQEKRT